MKFKSTVDIGISLQELSNRCEQTEGKKTKGRKKQTEGKKHGKGELNTASNT